MVPGRVNAGGYSLLTVFPVCCLPIDSSIIPFVMSSSSHVRVPALRLLTIGAGLVGLTLFSNCSQGRLNPTNAPETKPQATELRFDVRYLDSLDHPRSARTQRQLAIEHQLTRLHEAMSSTTSEGAVYEQAVEDGPFVGFPTKAARLADINRRIDSLKILEGIPLTPHN